MFGALFEEENELSETAAGVGKTGSGVNSLPPPPSSRLPCNLCGIYNQGATCYLNSLLQTLLFTPEFREALFLLGPSELGSIDDKDKQNSKVRVIPIQLQRLFARLLLANQQAVSTQQLTDSFGWTNNEELQQHDVQELNRILFSAIEASLVSTSGQTLISQLYHGTIVNQIICEECGRVSEREESFLDLPVTVVGNKSLEEALYSSFVAMEMMTGNNQYRCEICRKLVNARKGARLRTLPPILTLSLLRFAYDLVKFERYKETSKFTFPLTLNMEKYCENVCSVEDQLYDLYSVLIHRGSTHGGHYHAFIRDVDDLGSWIHPDEEEIRLPADPSSGQTDILECDSAVDLVKVIIGRGGHDGMSVNKIAEEICKQTGVSWNKRFKKNHGPMNKFLRRNNDVFILNQESNWVMLKSPSETPHVTVDHSRGDGSNVDGNRGNDKHREGYRGDGSHVDSNLDDDKHRDGNHSVDSRVDSNLGNNKHREGYRGDGSHVDSNPGNDKHTDGYHGDGAGKCTGREEQGKHHCQRSTQKLESRLTPEPGYHWFNFDDSRIHPITKKKKVPTATLR